MAALQMNDTQLKLLTDMVSNTVAANVQKQAGGRVGGADGHGGEGDGGRGGKMRLSSKGWENLDTFGG